MDCSSYMDGVRVSQRSTSAANPLLGNNVPFEAEYPKVAFSPKEPTPRPATEAVTMTRDGSSNVAFFCNSGANLPQDHRISDMFPHRSTARSGDSSNQAPGMADKGGTYNRIVLNTLFTFKSITLANAPSGCVSNFSPHVAPAFANRIST